MLNQTNYDMKIHNFLVIEGQCQEFLFSLVSVISADV